MQGQQENAASYSVPSLAVIFAVIQKEKPGGWKRFPDWRKLSFRGYKHLTIRRAEMRRLTTNASTGHWCSLLVASLALTGLVGIGCADTSDDLGTTFAALTDESRAACTERCAERGLEARVCKRACAAQRLDPCYEECRAEDVGLAACRARCGEPVDRRFDAAACVDRCTAEGLDKAACTERCVRPERGPMDPEACLDKCTAGGFDDAVCNERCGG